ncbi:MAG: hypothetical protein ABIT83_08205 [Massilia sp.]
MASDREAGRGWPGAQKRALERAAALIGEAAAPEPSFASNAGDTIDTQLAGQLAAARAQLRRACNLGQADDDAAPIAALAALSRACRLLHGAAPTAQQLAAALGMYRGCAVELGYNGGRALPIALAAILQVWSGRACHIVCASDFLSARAVAAYGALYRLCGCGVTALAAATAGAELEQAYQSDIVYATARQLLSDFMRDQLLLGGPVSELRRGVRARQLAGADRQPVTRGTSVALIDDIETVLLDDAVSPVVISAAGNLALLTQASHAAALVVAQLVAGTDYQIVREPVWMVEMSEQGKARLAQLAHGLPVYWRHPQRQHDLIAAAILARDALEPARHYLIQQGRVVIADESVLRLLAGRVWHHGLLQAIEVREGLEPSTPPRTVARGAYQTFFPRYAYLSGAGSCFDGVRGELRDAYGMQSVALGSANTPAPLERRYDYPDRAAKLDAFIARIAALNAEAIPVLASSPQPTDMVTVAAQLRERGIVYQVADGRDPEADAAALRAIGMAGVVTLMTFAGARNGELPTAAEVAAGAREAGAPVHGLLFEHSETARADRMFFAWAERGIVFASRSDDVANRPLPFWATPLRRLVRGSRFGDWPVKLSIAVAQWHSARYSARYRHSLGVRELQLDEQLAFSAQGQ